MKKISRVKALILCLCIFLTMLSGLSVSADSDILLGWDADLDFISLTFSEEIDLSLLEETLSLKQDGEDVEVSVEYNIHPDVSKLNNSYHVAKEYTYTITPADGMVKDALYVLSADGSIFGQADTFTKIFKVVELDSGMYYANKKDLAWNYFNGNNSNIAAMNYDSETETLIASMTSGWKGGRFARHYPTTAAAPSLKDYTVKMTYNTEGETTRSVYRLFTHFVDHTSNLLFEYQVSSDGKHGARILENDSVARAGGQGMNSVFLADYPFGSAVEIKLSVKDGLVNAYLNGVKIADYITENEHGGKAAFAIGVDCAANADPKILMSGYSMTQAIEYHSVEIDKAENVNLTDTVTITLPEAVADDFAPESYAILSKDGETVEGYTVELSDDRTQVILNFADLAYKTDYTVEFPEYNFAEGGKKYLMPVSFTTLPPEYDLTSFVMYDADGEQVESMEELFTDKFTVTARITNNRLEDARTATATVVIYNNLGQMCAISGDVYTLAKGEYADITIEDFECKDGETYSAKCFVWESFADMSPLFEDCIE